MYRYYGFGEDGPGNWIIAGLGRKFFIFKAVLGFVMIQPGVEREQLLFSTISILILAYDMLAC